jgi:dTMP kinase
MFITLEGGEGSGKSTLIKSLEIYFRERGDEVIVTREPGGSLLGEKIRALLLESSDHQVAIRAELLLFLAARAQHVEERIKPALKQGKVVLCDRFVDSTMAYQGYARGLGMEKMHELSLFASDNLEPDLTFYLDIEPEKGLLRAKQTQKQEVNDRIESETLSFHDKVRRAFITLADLYPKRMHLLDATQSPQAVLHQATQVLDHVRSAH